MTGFIEGLELQSQPERYNSFGLLIFRLHDMRAYGINVLKVREVLVCPALTNIPMAHAWVKGIATVRGENILVMDLSLIMGGESSSVCHLLVIEYEGGVAGFLVEKVDCIVNVRWEDFFELPECTGRKHLFLSVANIDGDLVGVLDVEKLLTDFIFLDREVSERSFSEKSFYSPNDRPVVVVVDDSVVMRKRIVKTLGELPISLFVFDNGYAALEFLISLSEKNIFALMLISDIEMPGMNGYMLVSELKENPALKDLYIILHTSLTGVFSRELAERVGANDFLAKFYPDLLVKRVLSRLEAWNG